MSNAVVTVMAGKQEVGIGKWSIRGAPPTVGSFMGDKADPWLPWVVIPILVDGKEAMALPVESAERFARALLVEVEMTRVR